MNVGLRTVEGGNRGEERRRPFDGLPSKWQVGVKPDGRIFFINDETRSTSWLDPRTNTPINTTKERIEGLPTGWEEATTAEGVYYFIDHNRMRTTFNSPLTGKPKDLERCGSDGSLDASPSPQRIQRATSSDLDGALRKITTKKLLGILKRDPDANVTLSGWLHKQSSRPPRTWKKRWFVLSEYCLFYYKSPSEGQAHARILLPGYEITPVTREDKIGKKFAFKAAHAGMRTYYFAGDSKETAMKWINKMTLATLMMKDEQIQGNYSESPDGQNSPHSQRSGEYEMPVLCGVQAFDDSDSVSGSVIEPVRNFANCEGADKRKLAKVSSVVRMESVTHSSEMTTMTLANDVAEEGSCKDSVDSPKVATPDSTTTTADVSELVAKITQLESDNWQLTKERQYYCSLVESSKTNLIDLKKSMFETLTGLQHELIEQQEANAVLKLRVEELEAEIDRTRPLMAVADQMVALGKVVADENETLIKQLEKASESLLLASEKAKSGPSQKLLEFSRKLQEEKQQQTQALVLREFLMSGEADLEMKLTDLGHIEDEMREASTLVTSLQDEKVALEHQLSEAERKLADQSERDNQETALLQNQLTDISQKLAAEEQAMEEKAQENTHLEEEVYNLRQRLQTAERINRTLSEQAGNSDQRKSMLQEELTNVQEELSKLVTEKGQLKNELANLKGSLLGNDELEDLLHESSASPEESPIRQRQSQMTRLEMTLELAAFKARLQVEADTNEKMTKLKSKLEREQLARQTSELGSYNAPKWVQELELRKIEKRRRPSKIRDPERLSFREKLEIFLQPQ
ncbi:uncharacterized protein LOC134189065 [Corticium candelabrum]|uniref:uncharacterized protein LOC134189065 n=1 Tax=Corticium candelabrum TaxID=121492 RepID=UPI002E273271|nr:uncharacterized protein LOC134189065 [Corticium candelabrum]